MLDELIMKAFILAAGFGARFRPLSDVRPKPLAPIIDRPLLWRLADELKRAGVDSLVVNSHHLADQIEATVMAGDFPLPARVSHEPEILGTGGAFRGARDFLGDEPFLVVNGDIYIEMDFAAVYMAHMRARPLATMVLKDIAEFNTVITDGNEGGDIAEHGAMARIFWFNPEQAGVTAGHTGKRWAYTGVQVVEPTVFPLIPEGFSSIIDVYLRAMSHGAFVAGYIDRRSFWDEAGDLGRYLDLHRRLLGRSKKPWYIGQGADVASDAVLRGFVSIGQKTVIGPGAWVEDSVIWPGARVGEGVRVKGSVVAAGTVYHDLEDEAYVG